MSDTPNLGLPLLAAAQAQKHVTHNEALFAIDALLHCAILDKDLAAPPTSPAAGARYIVPAGASGAWAGRAGMVAAWQDGAWLYLAPRTGYLAYVVDEALLYVFVGSAWVSLTAALGSIQSLGLLGIGTVADAANPFAAKLNKALWTARQTGEGGTGDLRYTLNKQTAANVLSLLFQTGFSGRLELGLVGSDNPVAKVSPDGTTWRSAVTIDAASGGVDYLSTEASLAAAATTDLGSVSRRRVAITGGGTITSFGSAPSLERLLRFTGNAVVVHNAASLSLPGAATIVAAPGDTADATSDASGNWTIRRYGRASGKATVPNNPAEIGLGPNASVSFGNVAVARTSIGGFNVLIDPGPGSTYTPALFNMSRWNAGFTGNTTTAEIRFDGLSTVGTYAEFGALTCYVGSTGPNGGPGSIQIRAANAAGTSDVRWTVSAASLSPGADNAYTIGTPALRPSVVYAASGSINTSDARLKLDRSGDPLPTPDVSALTAAELGWAADLARAIGLYVFRDSYAVKGAAARWHAGLTVQRAIALGEARGLDPARYAFVCLDRWDAVPAAEAIAAEEPVLDPDGGVLVPGRRAIPAAPAVPAGERYAFRPDQLALFIARGQEQRLSALEALLPAD